MSIRRDRDSQGHTDLSEDAVYAPRVFPALFQVITARR